MSLSYKWADQSTGTGRAGSNRSGIHGQGHAHHRIHAAGTSVHDGITEYPGRISVPFAASDMIWPCTATPASSQQCYIERSGAVVAPDAGLSGIERDACAPDQAMKSKSSSVRSEACTSSSVITALP